MSAALHLVAGSTGAGKTTYAMALAAELGGVRLSIDEWMVTLFGPDRPAGPPQFSWMVERVNRCEAQMGSTARVLGALGVPTVIDCGLTTVEHRGKWSQLARDAGLDVRLHHLSVDREERWRRVQRRNAERGETFRLEVTRSMFDFIERRWEPPSSAEMNELNGVQIA